MFGAKTYSHKRALRLSTLHVLERDFKLLKLAYGRAGALGAHMLALGTLNFSGCAPANANAMSA
jgi:hypothetical protein